MAAPSIHSERYADGARETRFVEMVFPEQANHYGTLFGGNALSLMGKAAFVAATRHARSAVVMATSDKIEFHVPVKVGEMAKLTARVSRVGRRCAGLGLLPARSGADFQAPSATSSWPASMLRECR